MVLWPLAALLLGVPAASASAMDMPGYHALVLREIPLPWGPAPDVGLAARLVECRDEMDRDLTRLSHGCPTNSSQATTEPACRLRVLILSFHSYESSDATKYKRAYLDSVVKLNTMYCKQWGFCDYKMIHNPSFHNSRLDMTGRSVAWQKVLLMHDYINTDKYDWVMWMDSDAAIIDQSVDLRWIIAKYAMSQYGGNDKVHMLVSSDIWPTPGPGSSNTGVWLMKARNASAAYLEEWWAVPDTEKKVENSKRDHPWEQRAWNEVMYEKHKDVHARLPMCYLFGYPLSLVDKPFIAHLCGPSTFRWLEREIYFGFWADRYEKLNKRRRLRETGKLTAEETLSYTDSVRSWPNYKIQAWPPMQGDE